VPSLAGHRAANCFSYIHHAMARRKNRREIYASTEAWIMLKQLAALNHRKIGDQVDMLIASALRDFVVKHPGTELPAFETENQ
jgi:hypothetical protein